MAYSQVTAMWAITKGSIKAMLRSPSSIVFGVLFPFIFIIIFGFIGGSGGAPVYKIALSDNCDTNNVFFDSIKAHKQIKILLFKASAEQRSQVVKGRLAGVLDIQKISLDSPLYTYQFSTTTASSDQWPQVLALLETINSTITKSKFKNLPAYAIQKQPKIEEIRPFKRIDFILPGQLGFSLLASGVFGVAFMFFNLRNTLVLKRFFATPIKRTYIVLGECLARVIFQMLTSVVILIAGKYIFGFTLINGFTTFCAMLFLSFVGLVVFMGFGFIVSGLSKTDSTIPPFANLITMPQFLLGGTFFGIEAFPKWLQPISKAMPLTHLNKAMRSVAFEGQSLWEVRAELGWLLLWGVIVYAIAIKVFKWEQ